MSVLRLERVTKAYRRSHLGRETETVALRELDLEVRRGEVFGLVGLNGAGKSTTIKLLLGLQFPTRGLVTVLGRPMPEVSVLGRIGYLPEGAYVSRHLTGREIVRFFARLAGIPAAVREAQVGAILDRIGMLGAADDPASRYSKGMLQRVAMAVALVHEPEILILDEPASGLDPMAVTELRELILWLKRRGKTVFFSSHMISEVEQVCDRIGILSQGRMARVLSPEDWRGAKTLERIFLETVARSERVGPMRFGEGGP